MHVDTREKEATDGDIIIAAAIGGVICILIIVFLLVYLGSSISRYHRGKS